MRYLRLQPGIGQAKSDDVVCFRRSPPVAKDHIFLKSEETEICVRIRRKSIVIQSFELSLLDNWSKMLRTLDGFKII